MRAGKPAQSNARRTRGLTLTELCFAMTIMAVVAGMAAPGFRTLLRQSAVRSATFEILAGLQQTRANSILESRPGSFCPAEPSGACLPASVPGVAWRSRVEGSDRTPQDAAEEGGQSLPRGVQVRATRSPIRFWPDTYSATTGTLTICDVQGIAAPRAIVISQTGRVRVTDAPAGACLS